MQSALVMISGGIDSAAALYVTAKELKTRAVFFDYGQAAADFELTAARQICRAADVPLEVVNLSGLKHFFLGLMPGPQIAIGFAGGPGDRVGNCPHGLFGLASTYCVSAGIATLVTGMHGEDTPNAAAMQKYLDTWGAAICELQGVDFKFQFPFLSKTKAQVVETGRELGVPLELTRSCTASSPLPCGECKACEERERAITSAG